MTDREYAGAVVDAMESGCSIEEVEGLLIDPASLNQDQKSALWLLAWSYVPKDRQRSLAFDLITVTG